MLTKTKKQDGTYEEEAIIKCPPQVVDLVEHLKASGTGETKCKLLLKLGLEAAREGLGADGWLAKVRTQLTTGTVNKIEEYMRGIISRKEASKNPLRPLSPTEEGPEFQSADLKVALVEPTVDYPAETKFTKENKPFISLMETHLVENKGLTAEVARSLIHKYAAVIIAGIPNNDPTATTRTIYLEEAAYEKRKADAIAKQEAVEARWKADPKNKGKANPFLANAPIHGPSTTSVASMNETDAIKHVNACESAYSLEKIVQGDKRPAVNKAAGVKLAQVKAKEVKKV